MQVCLSANFLSEDFLSMLLSFQGKRSSGIVCKNVTQMTSQLAQSVDPVTRFSLEKHP